MFLSFIRMYCLLTLVIFSKSLDSFSQNNLILDSFSAFETEGIVHLDWVIKSGNTCNGIIIQRSVDSINFSIIGNITGVCGNLSSPQPYKYVDETPLKNSVNYYRLELGGFGFSKAIAVEVIDYGTKEYQVRPNPFNAEAKIYFKNPEKEVLNFSLIDLNGSVLYSLFTNDDYLEINAREMTDGFYPFIISTKTGIVIITGKILVQH